MANPALLSLSGPVKADFKTLFTSESAVAALVAADDKVFYSSRGDILRYNAIVRTPAVLNIP